MSDTRVAPTSRIAELEKLFEEYKTKLELAEQESKEIVNRARQKAESISAEGQEKTQQVAEEIKRKAREEADRIISEAKNKAEQIVKEADDRAKKESKDRTKREVERIIANARQAAEKQSSEIKDQVRKEAEQIVNEVKEAAKAEAQKESAKIVAEAREIAKKVDEASILRLAEANKLLVAVVHKADTILNQFTTRVRAEVADLLQDIAKAKENLEHASAKEETDKRLEASEADSKTYENRLFPLRKELKILPPFDNVQMDRLEEFLKQVPKIRLAGQVGTGDEVSIYVDVLEPLPLLTILTEMSLIASSDVRGDTIKLRLRPSKNGG